MQFAQILIGIVKEHGDILASVRAVGREITFRASLLRGMVRIEHHRGAAAQRRKIVSQAVIQIPHIVHIVFKRRGRMRINFALTYGQHGVGRMRRQRNDEMASGLFRLAHLERRQRQDVPVGYPPAIDPQVVGRPFHFLSKVDLVEAHLLESRPASVEHSAVAMEARDREAAPRE